MLGFRRKRRRTAEIEPDEIFADSTNLAEFDRDRFEGRLERPLGARSYALIAVFLAFLFGGYLLQAGSLELVRGRAYAEQARTNQLARSVIFADRGFIVDRTGRELATNVVTEGAEYSVRSYAPFRGIAHVVGYAKPPAKDSGGNYFREHSIGIDGAEAAFDGTLAGENGLKLTETDAVGKVVSEATLLPPKHGEREVLSIDAEVTEGFYDALASVARESRFVGAAGVVMDVETGEVLAMVSYPEFSLATLADGADREAISAYVDSPTRPFLDRATQGLYAPGSIVKPVVAAGALALGVISPEKEILSTGSMSVPNPYDPSRPSIFKDWRANGWTDAREAIAVSSDIYFYQVGGGFEGQRGMGIANLGKYLRLFGFGEVTGLLGFAESAGNIPSPEWKAATFPEDPTWRLGDTYNTAIGQYGTQVTPLQAARAAAGLATGELVVPTLIASSTTKKTPIPVPEKDIQVAREGMRMGVREGIATAVNKTYVAVAAKTGTAQVGARNEYMNSWMIGFFPYEKPRYAFAVVLDRAPAGTLVGASAAMSRFFDWMSVNAPEYLQ